MSLATSLRSIINQLAWRGPTGRMMGHIVLERAEAEELASAALSFELSKAPAPKIKRGDVPWTGEQES